MNIKKDRVLRNNYKLKLTIIAFLMITVSVLVTYGAYVTIKGQSDENTITSSCFSTTFSDSSIISLTNAYPLTDEEGRTTTPYTINISNTCNLSVIYYVILSTTEDSISNDYINYSYFNKHFDHYYGDNIWVYNEEYFNNANISTLSKSKINTDYDIDAGYKESYIIAIDSLKQGERKSVDIRIWLNEKTPYIENLNWEGQIKVISAVAEHETSLLVRSNYKPDFGTDTSGANIPKLVDNLIPVVYDEENDQWIKASIEQNKWYNYDTQIWANAVTVTESTRLSYNFAPVGTIIPMDDILGMYVWIPRYEYQFTNLGTSYAGGTKNLPAGINVNFVSGTSTEETTDYIIHPVFRDGSIQLNNVNHWYSNNAYTITTSYQMGEWDEELSGFWYGKFETTGTKEEPTVKPNLTALRSLSIIEFIDISMNISEYHDISLESHMSKNSEWGAVAYLSQSIYGKYGNENYSDSNKEIYMNNSQGYYTGRSLGAPPTNTNYISSDSGSYNYNETLGVGASTTGNIYGIYDMVGGSIEYVLAGLEGYVEGLDRLNNYKFNLYLRHYNEYTDPGDNFLTACNGIACYGQALYNEIPNWYNDANTMFVNENYPIILRGGTSNKTYNTEEDGIFALTHAVDNSASDRSFRTVLT